MTQPLVTKTESALNAGPDVVEQVLHEACEIATVRLSALLGTPSCGSPSLA
jgi:hypothetical protein